MQIDTWIPFVERDFQLVNLRIRQKSLLFLFLIILKSFSYIRGPFFLPPPSIILFTEVLILRIFKIIHITKLIYNGTQISCIILKTSLENNTEVTTPHIIFNAQPYHFYHLPQFFLLAENVILNVE